MLVGSHFALRTPVKRAYLSLLPLLVPVLGTSRSAMAADGAARAPVVLEGKLIPGPDKGPALRASAVEYSLSATTTYLLHTLQDARLQNQEVRLEGTWKPDGGFEVAHLFTLRGGKLYKVRYYCEVCNIAAKEPGNCVCCQRPTELEEIPVDEVSADTVVVP